MKVRWNVSGSRFGFTGVLSRAIPACEGVRPPLRWLHPKQQMTTFSQVVWPPWARGTTWS